jgi:hypothetical protein
MPDRLVKQHRHYWEDAEHLLQLAKEYEAKVDPRENDRHNRYYDYWKFRLARMSFIVRMLAVEAMLNNALEVYGLDDKYEGLSAMARSFSRREKFPKISRKRHGHPFQVPLKWKLYLTPYLCRADSTPARDQFFQYDNGIYTKFKELIAVRNEFVHVRLLADTTERAADVYLRSGHAKPLQDMVFDHNQARMSEMLGGAIGPICFRLADAETCRDIIFDTIKQVDEFLGGRILSPRFWDASEVVGK